MEGSGIVYPTISIAGTNYTIKFSRGALYRLDKAGFDLRTLGPEIQRWFPRDTPLGHQQGYVRLSVLMDVLHAAIAEQLPGGTSPSELAEMAIPSDLQPQDVPKRVAEIGIAIVTALAKMSPTQQTVPLREASAISTERTQ